MSTINFDSEKNGYNKEQVTKYFELVQKEYDEMYSENQNLHAQLQQAQRFANSKAVYDIPPDRMEAIALALVSAQTEAQRIVNAAREKAWQIITDAKKGLPISEDSVNPSLPMNSAKEEESAVPQPQKPADDPEPKSTMDDLDELIKSILNKTQSGGD